MDKFAYSEECAVASGESGGMILTADGCMNRNLEATMNRDLELRDDKHVDGSVNLSYGMSAVREERMWLSIAYDLKRFGLKPTTESLEDFVAKHQDMLEKD